MVAVGRHNAAVHTIESVMRAMKNLAPSKQSELILEFCSLYGQLYELQTAKETAEKALPSHHLKAYQNILIEYAKQKYPSRDDLLEEIRGNNRKESI